MLDSFDAPAMLPLATLPAFLASESAPVLRPMLTAGQSPAAVVVLVEVEAKGV